MRALLPMLVLAVAACGSDPKPAPASATKASTTTASSSAPLPAPRVLDADTVLTTASGATLTAAKGWSVLQLNSAIVLDAPEKDLRVAVVEQETNEPASAWKLVVPSFARPVKRTTSPPPRDGWDEVVQTDYDIPEKEAHASIAVALRKNKTWYLLLIDASLGAFDRRGAQALNVLKTLRPAGMQEESFAGRAAKPLDAERLDKLVAFVEKARTRAQVPGVAMAIVSKGKIVLERGFGVRELGKKPAVSPHTLFMIGSTTKSLTTLLLAIGVDEGKLEWGAKAKDVLPSFALGDAQVTDKVLVKHTVCACTGLPRQDAEFIFEWSGMTAEKRLETLSTMRPTTGFGETFQYSNLLVAAGGWLAGHAFEPKRALGPAYETAMAKKVFGPLGMSKTTFDVKQATASEHALPHGMDIKLATAALPVAIEAGVTSVGPAGAAWSSAHDMARYALLELGKGKTPEGNTVVSEKNLLARREKQVKITDRLAYGLGLFVENDHGVAVVHHGGNTIGFTSDFFVLPDHDVGVVLLTNLSSANAFRSAVRRRVLELLFDGAEEAEANLEFALKKRAEVTEAELKKVTSPPDEAFIKPLLGTYANASLGTVTLRREGALTLLDAGEWKGGVGALRESDGSTNVLLVDPPLAGLTFIPGKKGDRATLTVIFGQQTYVFERGQGALSASPPGEKSGGAAKPNVDSVQPPATPTEKP